MIALNSHDLYEMYKNGEIDSEEYIDLMMGGNVGFDADVSYEKPRKHKVRKEEWK